MWFPFDGVFDQPQMGKHTKKERVPSKTANPKTPTYKKELPYHKKKNNPNTYKKRGTLPTKSCNLGWSFDPAPLPLTKFRCVCSAMGLDRHGAGALGAGEAKGGPVHLSAADPTRGLSAPNTTCLTSKQLHVFVWLAENKGDLKQANNRTGEPILNKNPFLSGWAKQSTRTFGLPLKWSKPQK